MTTSSIGPNAQTCWSDLESTPRQPNPDDRCPAQRLAVCCHTAYGNAPYTVWLERVREEHCNGADLPW
jgi:hypothetical protein